MKPTELVFNCLLFVGQVGNVSMAQDTIPCPGTDLSGGLTPPFYTKPLSERPNLAKILQNGYRPSLQQAAAPTFQAPGNSVRVADGFVASRPFRQVDARHCHPLLTYDPQEFIRCVPSSSSSFGSSNVRNLFTLLKEQLLIQAAVEFDDAYPRTHSFYNPSWDIWRDDVTSYLDSAFNCTDWGHLRTDVQEYYCAVSLGCQEFDTEFLTDLQALPVEEAMYRDRHIENPEVLVPYQNFIDKWGYGAVQGFSLGSSLLRVLTTDGPVLYMARAGGSGIAEILSGNNANIDLYTANECQDPEPVGLDYKRWDEFLRNDRNFDYELFLDDESLKVYNRTQIVHNFWHLFLTEYPNSLFGQVYGLRDHLALFDENCVLLSDVTDEPSGSPSSVPTPTEEPSGSPPSVPTTTTSPSLRPTHFSSRASSGSPSVTTHTPSPSSIAPSEQSIPALDGPISSEAAFRMDLSCLVAAVATWGVYFLW